MHRPSWGPACLQPPPAAPAPPLSWKNKVPPTPLTQDHRPPMPLSLPKNSVTRVSFAAPRDVCPSAPSTTKEVRQYCRLPWGLCGVRRGPSPIPTPNDRHPNTHTHREAIPPPIWTIKSKPRPPIASFLQPGCTKTPVPSSPGPGVPGPLPRPPHPFPSRPSAKSLALRPPPLSCFLTRTNFGPGFSTH